MFINYLGWQCYISQKSLLKHMKCILMFSHIIFLEMTIPNQKVFFMSSIHVSEITLQILLCSIIKKQRVDTSSFPQEADTDDQQGTLTYEEFSVFYKMMSLRRDLFLLMMAYSDRKDHLTAEELVNFLHNEQKVRGHIGFKIIFCWKTVLDIVTDYWTAVAFSRFSQEESAPLGQSITFWNCFGAVFCWIFFTSSSWSLFHIFLTRNALHMASQQGC